MSPAPPSEPRTQHRCRAGCQTGHSRPAGRGRTACAGLGRVPGAPGPHLDGRWSNSKKHPKREGLPRVPPWGFLTPNLLCLVTCKAISPTPPLTAEPHPPRCSFEAGLPGPPLASRTLHLCTGAPQCPAWFSSPARPRPTLRVSLLSPALSFP